MLAVLLVVVLVAFLAGCGKDESAPSETDVTTTEDTMEDGVAAGEEEPEEGKKTLENGEYSNELFALTVPKGLTS